LPLTRCRFGLHWPGCRFVVARVIVGNSLADPVLADGRPPAKGAGLVGAGLSDVGPRDACALHARAETFAPPDGRATLARLRHRRFHALAPVADEVGTHLIAEGQVQVRAAALSQLPIALLTDTSHARE